MKCPFIPGECLGRDCPGWTLGRCFLESFLQRMDNISLKLDTLCNLSSITASAVAPSTKTAQPAEERREQPDPDQDLNTDNQPTLWAMAETAPESQKPAAQRARETQLRDFLQSTLSSVEHTKPLHVSYVQHGTTSPAQQGDSRRPNGDRADPADAISFDAEKEFFIPDQEVLPGFPAKVSEIVFVDESEEVPPNGSSGPYRAVEEWELSLETVTAEEIATDLVDDLAVNERALLTAQTTVEQANTAANDAEPTFTGTEEPIHIHAEPAAEIQLTETTGDDMPGIPKEPDLPEQPAALAVPDALSVEKVIDDITGVRPRPVSAQPAGPVMATEEPAVEAPRQETPSVPELIAAEPAPAGPLAQELETPVIEARTEECAEEAVAVLETTPVEAQEPVHGADIAHDARAEAASGPEPAPAMESSALDVPSMEPVPDDAAIEVSVEALDEPREEEAATTDPATWEPVGTVQATGEAVLAIDFGSVLSKVALKPDGSSPATAVPLALTAYDVLHKSGLMSHFESRNEYVEDSLIYFDPNEFVFCGSLARKLSLEASEDGTARPAIQNLKTFLVRGGANLQIHSDFFPASENLDSQSVLAIYLAYLLRLTRHYLEKRSSKIAVDLDSTVRAFAIPTWIEDRYREDVKRLFRGAAAYAFCLERWLKDDLIRGVRLPDLRKALQEARQHRESIAENLTGQIMTESVAAGNSRMLGLTHERVRPLTLLVVNVGAGFTDFALFTVSYPEVNAAKVEARVAYKGGVGTGLGVWDNALKTLLFNRVKEIPAARRKMNEFRAFKTRLELQIKDIKETLMSSEEAIPVDVSPVLPEPILVERSELESSLPVKASLFGIRDGLRTYIKEAIKSVGMHRFDPGLTEILVTGGGAYVPSVVDCVREAVATLGPTYPSKVRAEYASALYTSVPNIGALFPLLAVALGTAEKEHPDEQAEVVPAAPVADKKADPSPRNRVGAAAAKGVNRFRLA